MLSKSYITPRPSELIKTTSATNIPKFVGCFSSNSSAANTPLRYNLAKNMLAPLDFPSKSEFFLSTSTLCSLMDNRDNHRKRSMIPRYMGAAASIEALTELQPVPDDREEELLALAASEASEASRRYF